MKSYKIEIMKYGTALIGEFIEDLENNWLEGKKKMIKKWQKKKKRT